MSAPVSENSVGAPVVETQPPETASGFPTPPETVSAHPENLVAATAKTTASKSKKKKSQVTVTMATRGTTEQGSQGENTGRWTAEEHNLFLRGLEQHGKGWKKIASLIKSRTVVQIRTHAQKYFQKLAKARQNGEEGEISMEGRGGTAAVPTVSTSATQSSKRRRQTSGTKRKAIQSVVSSVQRQGKKMAIKPTAGGTNNDTHPLPRVAPALSPYIIPSQPAHPEAQPPQPCLPSISTAQGSISGPALEDSLYVDHFVLPPLPIRVALFLTWICFFSSFRFLSPAPVVASGTQVNDVARQAGANPITVPLDQAAPSTFAGGEVSPTGVADLTLYPSWTDAKDTPSWYAKGSDVDALLDVADSLDWLTDTGDLHESYQPAQNPHDAHHLDTSPQTHPPETHEHYQTNEAPESEKSIQGLAHTSSVNNMSMNTLPHVDSAVEVPPLPSLFDGATEPVSDDLNKRQSSTHLAESHSSATIDEHLQVFDSPLEEHDFVSTILENTGESSGSLPVLG